MIFNVGMTIWILAFVLLGSLAGLGYRQGAVRVAFSLIGIFISALLAGPLAGMVRPLLPHLGIHNQTVVWLLSPFIVFVVLLSLFKSAGFFVHRKLDVYYRYKAGDLRQMLWERLNRRLGLCLGLVNGLVYLALISFVIFDFSYWTEQVAPSGGEARSVRMLNQLGRDLQGTGLAKVARAIDPMPEIYFKAADLAGLLCQNPQLADRLADYPPFISLAQRNDFKQLGKDADFQGAWKNHAPLGQLLNYPSAKAVWQNNDTTSMLWDMVRTNLEDLQAYLQTGQSEKYGTEKILGHWDINISTTFALLRVSRPNISSTEMKAVRAWMMTAYADTTFIAGSDGQAFLKNLPHLKPGKPPTTEMADWTGTWTADDTNYDLSLTSSGQTKSMTAQTDGSRLTLKDGESTLIFYPDN
jgi:uncharacterized membrane protein required for colicin V production